MGKKPVSILKAKDYDIYPILLPVGKADKNGYRGVNIRATDEIVAKKKKRKPDIVEIPVYDRNFVRVKGKKLENGKITEGYEDEIELRNLYNRRINEIQILVANYIERNDHVTNALLHGHIYNNKASKRQVSNIVLPVHDPHGRIVSSEIITTDEANELMKDLPNDLSKVVDADTGEMVFQSEADIHEHLLNAKSQKEQAARIRAWHQALNAMSPAEKFRTTGGYDPQNIFELFYSIKFAEQKFAGDWIVVKFYDYKERGKPKSSKVKDLSYQWFHDFLKFIFDNGYSNFSTKDFNPFKYESSKITDASIENFTDATFDKYCKWLRALIKRFIEEKRIPVISDKDIKKLTPSTFGIKKVHDRTRKNDSLFKEEFDKIFYGQFKDEIEERKNNNPNSTKTTKTVLATKAELEKSRDIFVLMTWLGGLRPIEYTPENVKVLKHGKGFRYVNYITSDKNQVELENPIISYSDIILKKYGYKLPFLPKETAKGANAALLIKHLRIMCKQLELDREFFRTPAYKGKVVRESRNLTENINRYFARKTFIQILKDEDIHKEDIEAFTGQSSGGEINAYYTNKLPWKIDKIGRIKPSRKK